MEGSGEQVDNDLRHASVVALSALGRSRDYRGRADAGRGLACLAETHKAVGPLLELVLDPDDTVVTRRPRKPSFGERTGPGWR
jgi:hypothetical protein